MAHRYPESVSPGLTTYFEPKDAQGLHTPHNDPLVVELIIQNCEVTKIQIDTSSNVYLIFKETLEKMGISEDDIKLSAKPSTGFTRNHFFCNGTIYLTICASGIAKTTKFTVMDKPAIKNVILVSNYHQFMKFSIRTRIFTLSGSQQVARSCYLSEHRMRTAAACMVNEEMDLRISYHDRPRPERTLEVCIDKGYPKRVVIIDADIDEVIRIELEEFLQKHVHIFAWTMADMKIINPKIASHELNIDPTFKPIKQK